MDIRNFQKPNKSAPGTSLSGMVLTKDTEAAEDKPNDKNTQEEATQTISEAQQSETLIDEYRKFLSEKGISDQMIFQALDTLVTSGSFYWQFALLNNIEVVFRVRSAHVNSFLVDMLEKEAPKTVAKFQDVVNIHNLAGTLHKFNTTLFDASSDEGFKKALAFVKSQPYVIVQRLIQELVVFDRLMFVVTSDWALENFTKPSPEEQE